MPEPTNLMNLEHTTFSGWALAVARTLESTGLDAKAIFSEANISDAVWHHHDARVESDHMTRLWELAVNYTQDHCFGLKVSEFIQPTSFDALGHALWASESLDQLFQRLFDYRRIISSHGSGESIVIGDEYHVRVTFTNDEDDIIPPTPIDTMMAFMVRICRELKGNDFNPLRVELMRPDMPEDPAFAVEFQTFFQAPVAFSQPHYCLVFDLAAMNEKLMSGNQVLAKRFDQMSEEYLARYESLSLQDQVKAMISELLPSGECQQELIAEKLRMKPRTLQYRLKELDTSYQQLFDEVRKDTALLYLKNQGLSVSETCFRLGFRDTSNFSRAFKRWYGIAPSEYLKAL